jgi:hypothetical protein
MKRQIVWPLLAFLILAIPLFVLAFPQPPAGNTGAPGDGSCNSCHSGSAGGGSASVTFPSGATYSPGVKQHLSVTVNDISHNAWSFQLTARLATNTSSQAGSFTATDTANTIVVASGTIQDMETTASGISQSTWSFDWTPPTTNVGNVNFYLIGLAAGGSGGATSGNGIYTATYSLTPAATADFSLSANPASLTVAQGASGTSTINVAPTNGFNGTVAFSAAGLPSGVTASFNSSGVMTLAASNTATTGTSTVTITGTSGSLTHTTTLSLTVSAAATPNFTLSASPSILAISQGTNGSSTITVTPQNGFNGTVAFAASGLPSGVTASFASNVMTVTASSTAPTGSSTITVTGTSGSLSHTTTVSLSVSGTVAPDFSLSASPGSVAITQGSSGKSTITVTPVGGFNGTVNLAASGLPSGVTASFASNVMTVTASSTAPTGSSTVTVTGTSGTLSHTTTINLAVSAATTGATLTAMPSSLSFAYTLNGSSPPLQNITVTTGSSLTFSVTTSGAWLSASPASGTGSGTVAVSVKPAGLAAGTYNGSVVIASMGATGSPLTIPVTLTVSSGTQSSFTVAPSELQFTVPTAGGEEASTSTAQKLSVTSSGAGVAYAATASTQTGGNWIVLGSASGTTPGSLTVSVHASGLAAGTYRGTITVTPTSSSLTPRKVPVTLIVGSPTRSVLNVWPRSLAFSFLAGGSDTASKTVHVTTSGAPQPFSATASGGSWLNVSPGSATTPASVTVSVDAHGLATGSYTGVITLAAGVHKYSVSVTAHVSSGTGTGGDDGGEAEAEIAILPTVSDPTESGTVGSQWLSGAGATTTASNNTSTRALALSKTANAPAGTTAGAQLVHAESLTSLTGLGFDLRSGSHCTATSPRFVVVTADDVTHNVVGCASGAMQTAPSAGWVRVSFDPTTQAAPAIIPGQAIKSISIVLDEGPEATSTPGSGLAVLDNIKVNGVTVGKD